MDMGNIIGDSFKYPVSNWKRLLILGIIVIISQFSLEIIIGYGGTNNLVFWLLIPAIIASLLSGGYQLRTIGTSIMGETEPPAFNEWTKMFIDGIKVFLLTFFYLLIPTAILMVGFFMLIAGSSGVNILGAFIILIGSILLIIVGLILVMATANMAYHEEFGAGFRFGEIQERIKSIGWLNYILILIILIVIYVIIAVGAALLELIPFVGLFIACLIVYPYMYLFIYRASGLIFKETLDEEPEELQSGDLLETEEI